VAGSRASAARARADGGLGRSLGFRTTVSESEALAANLRRRFEQLEW
jgi:hypothetical protein